jgi:hypothetical protein
MGWLRGSGMVVVGVGLPFAVLLSCSRTPEAGEGWSDIVPCNTQQDCARLNANECDSWECGKRSPDDPEAFCIHVIPDFNCSTDEECAQL